MASSTRTASTAMDAPPFPVDLPGAPGPASSEHTPISSHIPQDPAPSPLPSTRVEGLTISGTQGQKATLTLADGTVVELDTEVVLQENLRKGDPVDGQLRARLVEAGVRRQIREAGLRLLSHRARSRKELEDRLRKKGFAVRMIRPVLDDFQERGYLDDAAFARAFIADRLRLRPRGRRALAAELRRKGVEGEVAERALEEAFREEDVSDSAIAGELAEAWLRKQPAVLVRALLAGERTPDAEKALRRFQGYMGRRGIPGNVIFRTLDRLRERERDGTEGDGDGEA